ncbi:TM2 domain-containing protein [Brevibacterium spongiae]|uniref:TM2 domain-containing protein n=1 Tax=Brevibacterium spongiae TaxID=2909672 RepID=A0ABY5SMN6_9MICO|nr:TM2 domain-containing protein [Brevibacterium spongiae]UVI35832.1 TM2 domain-containing protein [Brevibacterium spongiae]
MTATTEIPAISSSARADESTALHSPGESALPLSSVTPLSPLPPLGCDEAPDASGNRSFVVTWLLSLLFGFLGLDRFYTGRYSTGAMKALSLGGLGIWWIIDLGMVLAGGLRYGSSALRGYARDKEIAWIGTGLTLIVAYSLQVDALIGSLLTGLL